MNYTLEQVKAAVDSHTEKIKQQIDGSQRGDAVDLTADLIKLNQVEQAGEALKHSITGYLTELANNPTTQERKQYE